MAFIKQPALTKRINLQLHIAPDLPDISLDERRMRQALLNLLSNAVKFTPQGGSITVEAKLIPSLQQSESPCSALHISVIDSGIGIEPDSIPKLFQPFIQIDSSLNRKFQGSGLGLSLVKQIVELHGGTVKLESHLGQGSRFTIELPYNIAGSSTLTDPSESPEIAKHIRPSFGASSPLILLAEDNEANITTIATYLEAKGYELIVAKDGQQAISLAESHAPELILMDIQMPVVDGMTAIREIRKQPRFKAVPIIALTALAMDGDRDRCLAAGADEYLSKPVILKQLTALIEELCYSQNNE